MLPAILSLAVMGALFGGGLAYASKKFAVEVDPRVEAILEVLPGANCGGCGYPGCGGAADAIVKGEAAVDCCPPGGAGCAAKIAEIMGMEVKEASERFIAQLICNGGSENCSDKYQYQGMTDCKAAASLSGGPKSCQYACIGLGTCAKVCPFGAITMGENNLPIIDSEKCVGCNKCVVECPQNVLKLVGESRLVHVVCNNQEKGKIAKSKCKVACIKCKLCEKSCPVDAIHVVKTDEGSVAVIDYDKCINCGICAQKCPTDAIKALFDPAERPKARIIEDKCIGCTLCKRVCPVDAISGEVKQKHVVDRDKCVACGLCVEKCKKDAIEMVKD